MPIAAAKFFFGGFYYRKSVRGAARNRRKFYGALRCGVRFGVCGAFRRRCSDKKDFII